MSLDSSKRFTVAIPTSASSERRVWLKPSKPLAALICAAMINGLALDKAVFERYFLYLL
jgi:hypothetical protein